MTQNRIEEILYSSDIGFSDTYKDENVRDLTFQGKIDILEHAVEIMNLEEAMNSSVSQSQGTNIPTAEIYAIDFPSDLKASIYILLGGYYKQAILCLRNWLEMRLTGIYYNFINKNKQEYEKWKKGDEWTLTGCRLIRKLFGHIQFEQMNRKIGLRNQLEDLYEELSAFTPGKGLEEYDIQRNTKNVPRFNSQSVDLWFSFVRRIFQELVICFLVVYGEDAFSGMQKNEIKSLYKNLPEKYQQELRNKGIVD